MFVGAAKIGPMIPGALGSVATRWLVRRGLSTRRWAFGTVLGVCGMLCVGCEHTAGAARPTPSASSAVSVAPIAVAAPTVDLSYAQALFAAAAQVQAQVNAATSPADLMRLAIQWEYRPPGGTPLEVAQAEWAAAYLARAAQPKTNGPDAVKCNTLAHDVAPSAPEQVFGDCMAGRLP